jgi:hypothetical protein
MILVGCSSSRAAPSTPSVEISPAVSVEISPAVSVGMPSSTMAPPPASEVATSDPTTTLAQPADVITRPYVDPTVCGAGAVSVSESDDLTVFPFGAAREQPIPVQVLAAPVDGVAKPFAVVLRVSADSRHINEDHSLWVNGTAVGITMFASGNGAAAWTLPDGTKAYMRARDLDEAALVGLVARLTPRDPGAPIPGFDLQPSSDPTALVLLHEHLNTGLSETVTTFQCQVGLNHGLSRIRVIDGDPVFVYLGIIDAPRPYAVGVNGDGAITITNTYDQSVALLQVLNADAATWAALPTIEQT